MDGKISQIVLVVRNQQESLEFYTEKVEFEIRTDSAPRGGPRFVTVAPKGQDLEISLWELGAATDPSQMDVSRSWSPGKSPPILLQVSDCRGMHKELSERGVKFIQEPVEHPWGTSATFADPDGNLFSMNQPPAASAWGKK
jgi:predicted enzyme related to lactoylglutathione lyase